MSALLLLPGLLLDRRLFDVQIEALGAAFEITVPDLSRHQDLPATARAVLEEAPDRFALCGLSMGGYVALEIMRQAPERVTRLALLDTQARADDEEMRRRREGQIGDAAAGRFGAVIEELHPAWLHPSRQADPALRESLRAMAGTIGAEGFVREMRTIMSRPDSRSDLGRIRCPTLVLCGRDDLVTPPGRHEEMAAAISDATLVVLPGCGHLPPLERPDAVSAQLRAWLTA